MALRGPILVATDFSDAADAALRQAAAIASSLRATLVVCHVLPEILQVRPLFPQDASLDTAAQSELTNRAAAILRHRLASVLGETETPVTLEIETGSPHAGILAVAERIGAGLVVVGPGRTAHQVARGAHVAVLVARPSPSGGAVLGATDFSDPALPAVHLAVAEAARRGAALRLLHCLTIDPAAYLAAPGVPGLMPLTPLPPTLIEQLEAESREHLQKALAAAAAQGEVEVRRSPSGAGIVESAHETATSLVVVGTRGRTGLARVALGSVAEYVMGHAPCSVMVVPLHPTR